MGNIEPILAALSAIRPSSTLLALHGYRSAEGEVSDRVIGFHVSYENALNKSAAILRDLGEQPDPIAEEARQELLASFRKSLDGEGREDPYVPVLSPSGEIIRGIKAHPEKGRVYIFGMQMPNQKRILVPGTYKPVNKRAKTIAKDRLRELLPVSRWRMFILDGGNVDRITVERMTFEL